MDLKEITALVEEQKKIVDEIRQKQEDVEKGKFTKAEAEEFETKANTRFDELTTKIEEMKKLSERIDDIETKMKRPGNSPDDKNERSLSSKAFDKWLRFGRQVLTADETKTLKPGSSQSINPEVLRAFDIPEEKVLTISGDTGISYLAPGEYRNEIIKGVTEISPMRTLADVKPTSKNFVEIPKRTGQFAAVWTTEVGTRSETTGLTYGMETIPNHEMYALVKVSRHSLEDSEFNLEAELSAEFSEQFAKAEGAGYITGTSVGQPEGFTVNADVDSSTIVYDVSDAAIVLNGLIDLIYAPKTAYARNGTLIGNRSTIALIRKAKDANNKYYWEPDFQAGTPGRFMGVPITEMPDMASLTTAGYFGLAFGDFRRAYVISDRVQIEVQRLVELYAESGQVGFIARKRVGGQVVLAEAIYIGKSQA